MFPRLKKCFFLGACPPYQNHATVEKHAQCSLPCYRGFFDPVQPFFCFPAEGLGAPPRISKDLSQS